MPKPPPGMVKKHGAWYVRRWRKGRERWIWLGREFASARERFHRIRAGERPPSRVSVGEAAGMWISRRISTRRNQKGTKIATSRAEQYLKPYMGHMLLRNVGPDDLNGYRRWLDKQSIAVGTISHILSDARCFFLWAAEAGYIARSPFTRGIMPRLQEKMPERLSDEEIGTLIDLPDPVGWTIRFGLISGLRWGEMCRALVSDVSDGVLTVHHRTKSKRIRRVPLPQDFIRELRGRIGKIVPWSESAPGSFACRVRRESGITRYKNKMLRDTYACLWLERGGNMKALQQILGHKSIETTERYGRLIDQMVEAEACRVYARAGAWSVLGGTVDETVDRRILSH